MKVSDINSYIKKTLIKFCEDKSDRAFDIKAEYIIYLNDEEFNKLSNCKITYEPETIAKLRFAVIDINDKRYFITAGSNHINIDNKAYKELSIDNVLFLATVWALNIQIREDSSVDEIQDILYPMDDPHQQGYEYDMISKFFEPFTVYEVQNEELDSETKFRTAISKILLQNKTYIYLNFSTKTIDAYTKYYDHGIYDDNIFNSIFSYCWRYCFLDVYRCIEPMFAYAHINKLKNDIKFNGDVELLYNKINTYCGWKPKEDVAIETLFSDDNISDDLKKNFKGLTLNGEGVSNIGKSIYKLRNRIVHHQGTSTTNIEKELSAEAWNELIEYLIEAITELKLKFQDNSNTHA